MMDYHSTTFLQYPTELMEVGLSVQRVNMDKYIVRPYSINRQVRGVYSSSIAEEVFKIRESEESLTTKSKGSLGYIY
jgi:hypothetical protein